MSLDIKSDGVDDQIQKLSDYKNDFYLIKTAILILPTDKSIARSTLLK